MKTPLLKFLVALLLLCSTAADSLQAAASAATNRIRGSELSTTNRIYGSNTLFAVVFPYPHPYYTNGTMQISADDLLSSLQQLSGWTGGGSGNGLTNNDTRAIQLLSSLRVTGRVTNDNVVQFKENIGQDSGYNADLWFLSARTLDLNGTNIATALHIIQTNVVWTSNELYSAIIAAGISANTATNISRYWATNAALTTSNQLMNLLASRTNPTLYGTVTVPGVTASEVAAFDSSKGLTTVPGISPTELGFIDGLEENVQDAITSLSSRAGLLESQTVTNELSAALQIVNRILSLSPGVLSNIVASGHGTPYIAVGTNGGTLSFATNLLWRGLVISNDAAGIYSIHAPAASGGSGTNNPITLTATASITLLTNQTVAYQYSTNQSHPVPIIGSSNQSSGFRYEEENTSTNFTYITNAAGFYDLDDGTTVNAIGIPPLSILRMNGWLDRSNRWVIKKDVAQYALEFANGSTGTNHTTKKITYTAPSSGGSASYNTTNIIVSTTNEVVIDVASWDRWPLMLITNLNLLSLSNVSAMVEKSLGLIQQNTNGGWRIENIRVIGGQLQMPTNNAFTIGTNAGEMSTLEVEPAFFATNLFGKLTTNYHPRISPTNSLLGESDITFVSYSTNAFNATSTTLDLPAGTQEGDFLLFLTATDSANFVTNTPAGTWSLIESNTLASAGFAAYWKVADGGEDPTQTFTFQFSEIGASMLLAFRHANASSPFDTDSVSTQNATALTTPSITPSANNSMLIGVVWIDPAGSPVFSEVSGFPLRGTAVAAASGAIAVATRLQTTAANEGVQITTDTGATYGIYTISIKK